jgi:hypothetical protein
MMKSVLARLWSQAGIIEIKEKLVSMRSKGQYILYFVVECCWPTKETLCGKENTNVVVTSMCNRKQEFESIVQNKAKSIRWIE